MQVSDINGVKIYNLTSAKSLPEWLSSQKKRALLKKDEELGRRIDLIQDFEMPAVTNCISLTKDNNYILCAGVYKPRIRCYDVKQLSMKFERCVDSEIIKMHILSEDYTKFICLEQDRYIEFHASSGFHYKTRIPKPGRDMDYHPNTCDVYFVGTGSEVYRLNLEQGRFLNSLQTNARIITACQFNPVHHLFSCVTTDGYIESWDPRARERVSNVNCQLSQHVDNNSLEDIPGFTCLKYKDALHLGVGTNFGVILLYDIRSNKPYLVKDHMYGLPIKRIDFYPPSTYPQLAGVRDAGLVASMDSKILKIWPEAVGSSPATFASIEPGVELNDHVTVPGTGMMFLAAETPKVLSYFLPQLGPAPKWYPYLDTLTEELENEDYHNSESYGGGDKSQKLVYDNYKFVTRAELESLGLEHLVGTDMLRAYMHGYFMDSGLYFKTKALVNPFAYAEYKKAKVRERLQQEFAMEKLKIERDLPKVNAKLAEKIVRTRNLDRTTTQEEKNKKGKRRDTTSAATLFEDGRFKKMFADTNYEIDPQSEEFKFINPIISKMDKKLSLKRTQQNEASSQMEVDEGTNKENMEDGFSSSDEEGYFFSKSPLTSTEDDEDSSIPHTTPPTVKTIPFKPVPPTKDNIIDRDINVNLEKRIEELRNSRITTHKPGNTTLNKEMTFVSQKKEKRQIMKGSVKKSGATHLRRPVGELTKLKKKRR